MDTGYGMCSNEPDYVLMATEIAELIVEEIEKVPLREAKPENDGERAPTVVPRLKIVIRVEEASHEKMRNIEGWRGKFWAGQK